MQKCDFSYSVNAEGYMIQYKGQNIGGSSILGKYRGREKARIQQINDYINICECIIINILAGNAGRFKDSIEKIDGYTLVER